MGIDKRRFFPIMKVVHLLFSLEKEESMKPYETPEIIYEGELEVQAGSPGSIKQPFSLDDL